MEDGVNTCSNHMSGKLGVLVLVVPFSLHKMLECLIAFLARVRQYIRVYTHMDSLSSTAKFHLVSTT